MGLLSEKTVLITGSTSGIGKVTTQILAQEGANLILSGRNQEVGYALANTINKEYGSATFIPADLQSKSDIDYLFSKIESKFTQLDAAINNAGIYPKRLEIRCLSACILF
jgi:short-subunit dehydrogenase